MKRIGTELIPSEQAFINEYLKNGFNGVRAYLAIHPDTKYESARVKASKLLTKVTVREAIQREIEKASTGIIASRENLIREAYDIGKQAQEKGDLGTALKSTELKAKLNRLFDRDQPDIKGYEVLMQQFVVNVSPSDNDKDKVIDIEAGDEGRD